MRHQAQRLMLVISVITFTDTFPSITSDEGSSRSPNIIHYSTESPLRDEIIYATNVAPSQHGTHHSSSNTQHITQDQNEDTVVHHNTQQYFTTPQPLYSDEEILPTYQTYPEVFTLLFDTPFPHNPFNDEILEKASRLSNGNYDDKKYETMTANPSWSNSGKDDESVNIVRNSNVGLEERQNVDRNDDEILRVDTDVDNRPGRMNKQGVVRKMESYSESIGLMDDGREGMDRRITSPAPVLVWGELARGIVAATLDYGKGEVGRRPLVLAGTRGRARSGPYFEDDTPPSNITAPAGSTVYMDCRVAMLQDKVVTWAARRDDQLHLLTVAKQAYSADKRFSLSFRYPNNWRLSILGAQRQDQGLYECQVAAHPPIIRQIYLTVISPEVNIWDESGRSVVERYYKSGSSLQLTCSAWQLLQPPELLSWWKDSQHLTEGISCNVTGSDSATCTLIVDQVSRSHAGTYTCGAFPWAADAGEWASGAPPTPAPTPSLDLPYTLSKTEGYANATVAVHVLHGNLIGVAVLPNTGKSAGMARTNYISVHKFILGLSMALYFHSR